MSGEMFGIPADENGNIRFMTVDTEEIVRSLEDSMEMFKALGELALQNKGYLPILKLYHGE